MKTRRWTRLLPSIIFVLHTLLVLACAAMAWRSKNDPLTMIFFLPVTLLDLPQWMMLDFVAPTLTEWLTPLAGGAKAAEYVIVPAVWSITVGSLHWVFLAWLIGAFIDRRRMRCHVRSTHAMAMRHMAPVPHAG